MESDDAHDSDSDYEPSHDCDTESMHAYIHARTSYIYIESVDVELGPTMTKYLVGTPISLHAGNGPNGRHDFILDGHSWSLCFDGVRYDLELYNLSLNEITRFSANVKLVCPEFSSKDAEVICLLQRATRVICSDLLLLNLRLNVKALTQEGYEEYVAFWQAWSVPVCDDVRRVVFGFLA